MSRIDTPRRTEVAENRIWFLSLLVLSPPINHPTTPASSQHYASLTIPQSDTQATQWSCPEWRAHSTPDELCSDRNWLRQIGSAAERVWLGVEWSGENKQQRYVKIWAFRSSARLVINCRKGVGHKVLVLHFRYTVHFAAASPNLVLVLILPLLLLLRFHPPPKTSHSNPFVFPYTWLASWLSCRLFVWWHWALYIDRYTIRFIATDERRTPSQCALSSVVFYLKIEPETEKALKFRIFLFYCVLLVFILVPSMMMTTRRSDGRDDDELFGGSRERVRGDERSLGSG